MDQTIINWIIGGVGALIGIFLKDLLESVKSLRSADALLAERVGGIEVLVAGTYAKREEVADLGKAIFTKLDRIENKLDGKVDK